ncbi:MAG: hypothetical protein M1156_00030, partial [Candidatus Marsarchaeota archaeon]|nr:hypothetical protein [Candidatus Marsarchaeota archaeon]
SGKSKMARKLIALKAVAGMRRYIDKEKQPKSVNFGKLLMSVIFKHDFQTMGAFQLKSLFLGMMHFQDEYTYDIKRVEKCDIHYAMPDGRVLPFCTFNVFPEVYRDKIQKQYSIPSKEWENMHHDWTYRSDKYMRNVKELEATEAYKRAYAGGVDYFKLPVNIAEAQALRAAKGKGQVQAAPKATVAPIMAQAANDTAKHTHKESEGDSCDCGSEGSCGCGGGESGGCGCGGA